MRWYYLSETQETIPTTEDQLPALASQGLVRATTPLWHHGLSAWASASELHPALFSGPTVARQPQNVAPHKLASGLVKKAPWGIFSGIVLMLSGIVGVPSSIFGLIKTLGLQFSTSKLGPEAKAALRNAIGPEILYSPAELVIKTVAASVGFAFAFVCGLQMLRGLLKCQEGNREGLSWKTEQGLNKMGSSLLFAALALATYVLCMLLVSVLQRFGVLDKVPLLPS